MNFKEKQEEEKRVLLTDSVLMTASKIYYHFAVNQSCTVRGMVLVDDEPFPKGEQVIIELERLDRAHNFDKNNRRRRVKPENSIGDYVSQKMFIWEMRIHDKKPVYTIWRKQ